METLIEQTAEKSLKDRVIDLIQKEVPDYMNNFFYCMGATPLILFFVAATTGILMTFYYIPFSERAYESVRAITSEIYLGWFIRGLHKVSINLMIFTLFLHLVRVFVTRAYKTHGELKWLIGTMLFFTTLAMGFTGYSLVYDHVSYWGMTVVMNMAEEMPVFGPPLAYLLRGGAEVSELTLLRLYDLHTKLLPLLLILLIGGHIIAITVLGFAKVEGSEGKHMGKHMFYPEHAMKVGLAAVSLLILMVNLVMIFPPNIGVAANPLEVASNVAPPWYFSAVYKWITIAPRQPALFGVLLFCVVFVAYPYIDRFLTERGFNMGRINIVIGSAAVLIFVILTLWNVMI
ncbi:MAG: cytochrome b N-terminal domain-containing protein [Deltaproteobacteria bacterium]|nr:cytochrome b N-terminal domain-containing protein [Deltaproteobacteria bacterium]